MEPDKPERYWQIFAANGALVLDKDEVPLPAFVPVRQLASTYNEKEQIRRTAFYDEREVSCRIEELQAWGVMVRASVYQVKQA